MMDQYVERKIKEALAKGTGQRKMIISLSGSAKKITVIGITVFIGACLLIPPMEIYQEVGFIDQNTGSRYGHTSWVTGHDTKSWMVVSALDSYLKNQPTIVIERDWVKYRGTGFNLFGKAISFQHERPSRIIIISTERLNQYVESIKDTEKIALYKKLKDGDKKVIEEILSHP